MSSKTSITHSIYDHQQEQLLKQINRQAFGSHAIMPNYAVDAEFDHFPDEDQFLDREGRFNPLYETSHV